MYEPQHAALLLTAKREIETLRRLVEEQRGKLAAISAAQLQQERARRSNAWQRR